MMAEALTTRSEWRLSELLNGLAVCDRTQDPIIRAISIDSHSIDDGSLFVALKGQRQHGITFVGEAISRGASAVIWEPSVDDTPVVAGLNVPVVAIPALRQKLGIIADRYFHHPSRDITVIGVTGTDGKTSVTQFIAQALADTARCGVIGTLGYGPYGALIAGRHTTPDCIRLNSELAALRDSQIRYAALEASSHGLEQGRLDGVNIDIAVLTNLSHDHLDYHQNLQSYAQAKRKLFEMPDLRHAILNLDDPFGRELSHSLSQHIKVTGYGLNAPDENFNRQMLQVTAVTPDSTGMHLDIQTPHGQIHLQTALMGRFNASNILAVLGVLLALGKTQEDCQSRLAALQPVPGRMEIFASSTAGSVAVVDYAHTPAALTQALSTLREHYSGKIWCVFGCGGDRDSTKRPLMGRIAESYADHAVITDDNLRSETPKAITDDIQRGMHDPQNAVVIHDRHAAILHALESAAQEDVVLIAGKGHETTQIVGGVARPFSDREIVAEYMGEGIS